LGAVGLHARLKRFWKFLGPFPQRLERDLRAARPMKIKLENYALTLNEYNLPTIVRGNVRIDWVNLNEGLDGDYNPEDPNDINLLRFDVYRHDGNDWQAIEDGSFCTQVTACTQHHQLFEHLVHFLDTIYDDVSNHGRAKRLCESLSWTR